MLIFIGIVATLWSAAYTAGYDWLEARYTSRSADRRSMGLRVLHAIGLEGGLACLTVPILAAASGLTWLTAMEAAKPVAEVGTILKSRGVPVESLPREIITREPDLPLTAG